MGKLSGKVAVITGGNSGIGLATAVEFAREDGVARAAFAAFYARPRAWGDR